ncbi:hypothetical protein CKO28_17410 [Rhodovibrio sodomensis]|uniref:Alpha/beta hydrolase n=1 Tax=Rhodovibrio sodomensis TaxID=1088 RepID=A0ABS1DII5_9PROT|nr:hypothetical protein [Rhodovibrio sodomensis]MBK1669816.1 hypothetical protein [Rhodovibrio sodomensis]
MRKQRLMSAAALAAFSVVGLSASHGHANEPVTAERSGLTPVATGEPVNVASHHSTTDITGHGRIATKRARVEYRRIGRTDVDHLVVALNRGWVTQHGDPLVHADVHDYAWAAFGEGTSVVSLYRPGYSGDNGMKSIWTGAAAKPERAETSALVEAIHEIADYIGPSRVTVVGFGPGGADAAGRVGDELNDVRAIGITGNRALESGEFASDKARAGLSLSEARHEAIMAEWEDKRHSVRRHPEIYGKGVVVGGSGIGEGN